MTRYLCPLSGWTFHADEKRGKHWIELKETPMPKPTKEQTNIFGVSQRTARDNTMQEMRALTEFIAPLPVPTLMVAIIDNLEQRTDFDPEQLERFSNQIGQIAHEAARSRK